MKNKILLEINGGSWTTTTPSGFRVASVAGKEVKVQPILAYHATDPFSGTVSVLWFISLVSIVDCCNINDTCIGCGHKRGKSAVCAEERWDGDCESYWWDAVLPPSTSRGSYKNIWAQVQECFYAVDVIKRFLLLLISLFKMGFTSETCSHCNTKHPRHLSSRHVALHPS